MEGDLQQLKYLLMAENYHKVVALIKVNPDHIEQARPLVKELAEASRKEEGVVTYDIYRVNEKPGLYVFLEIFKDAAAFEAHKTAPHFAGIIEKTKPFLLEPPTIVSLIKEDI